MRFIVLLILLLHSFIAQSASWVINKDHSDLMFQIEYLGMSKVHGRFKTFEGQITFNEQGIPSEINMVIQSATIDTGNSLRDSHLKRSDFFNIKQFPVIIFKSANIKILKREHFKAEGQLTIKGITEKVVIDFYTTNTVTDTWGYENKFVNFRSKIKRSSFDLSWNKTLSGQKFILADEVEFSGNIQIQPASSKTPTSKFIIPDTKYIREKEKFDRGEIKSEDFNQEFKEKSETIPVTTNIPLIEKKVEVEEVKKKNSWLWWTAYFFIGFLGFISLIISSFYIKTNFKDYFPKNYRETGLIGHISDFIIIVLALLFSAALYVVGQGI